MTGATVDVEASPDGTLVIQPHGVLGADDAIELRHTLIHAIRRARPMRLVLHLGDVHGLTRSASVPLPLRAI